MGRQVRKFFTYDDLVIPMHGPRGMVAIAREQGADLEALLRGTGIVRSMLSNPDARVSHNQVTALVENALRLTGNPALGLDFGSRVQVSHLGMLGLAAMSCPDIRSAVDLALKYYRTLMPIWDLSLSVHQGTARFVAREAIPLGERRVFAVEALLAGLAALGRNMLGRELPIIEVMLPFAEPAHSHRYAELTRAPIRFDCPHAEVLFDASVFDHPLISSDPITRRTAERQIAAELSAQISSEDLVTRVRGLLDAEPGNYPDLEALARTLQTSTRTLRRTLKGMRTSYQKLLDEVRRKHAMECVTGTEMKTDQMADRLGFSEVRSFRRAFKRWTGQTPTQYRKMHRSRAGR